MKFSISNIGWNSYNDSRVYDLMKQYGFFGLEIAPTRIITESPYEHIKEAKKWSESLKDEMGIEVSSMQSIWYGRNEEIFSSLKERQILFEYTKKAICFAQAIGCKNLVFGCPKNRNIKDENDFSIGIEFFKELGDYAFEHNTVIGMEANPTIYNTNYINDTKSALKLISDVDNPGFKLNLDIGTMIQNEESIEMLVGNVHHINHVHISEPRLKPVQKRPIHKELKDLLTIENYQKYISIEMGTVDDLTVIEETMNYVTKVFS